MPNQVVYGFHSLQDRFSDLVTTVGADVLNGAIDQAMAEHNRQMAAVLRLFVRPGVEAQTVFRTAAATRNQPLDEFGRPIPIKAPGRYTVGFPLVDSGSAIGYTYQKSLAATVQELNNVINSIQIGDMRWVFDHILGALFANASYTFFDTENAGQLTVLPLANGDAQTYQVFAGGDANLTDTHLLAQANAIGAGADNPYPTIYQELIEHPENGGGRVIAFIPTGLKAATQALATFNPVVNANITPGANSDVLSGELGVDLPGTATVLGMEDSGVWIAEWPRLPAGYIVAVAVDGDPPIGERQSPLEPLRGGLVEIDPNEDMPWYQRNWMRQSGYGAWNRVGALVYRVGNASYAVPTGYAVPMP